MKGQYISPQTVQQLRHIQTLLDQLSPEAAPRAFIVPGSPEPRDAIIVFPGSFNPPTKAHLALLKQAQRFAHEHEPMYLYAATSKHTVDKETVERPLLVDRLHLLEVVLNRRLPHAGIMLFNRGLYVEEAEAIRNSFPKVKRILFLVGFDKIVQIYRMPHRKCGSSYAKLVHMHQPCIFGMAPRSITMANVSSN